jgi:hypothetical protein
MSQERVKPIPFDMLVEMLRTRLRLALLWREMPQHLRNASTILFRCFVQFGGDCADGLVGMLSADSVHSVFVTFGQFLRGTRARSVSDTTGSLEVFQSCAHAIFANS